VVLAETNVSQSGDEAGKQGAGGKVQGLRWLERERVSGRV